MQERELPHLPTNLHVQEQDSVLNQVNDRLSQCAFDFVAKYQFPIPLTQDMRPVERPQDREWTEWVYLLKRLATSPTDAITLGATQAEVAEELGTVREVVVRSLRELREEGVLTSAGRGGYRVLDLQALQERARSDG